MVLKTCTEDDIHRLVKIAQTTYREHYQYLWKDKGEHYIQTNYNAKVLKAELADENIALYLITKGEEIYGFIKLQIHASFANYSGKDALELARIYLLKKGMNKGLGKAVMKAIEAIAKSHTKKVIWLKTMDSSQAATFYQSRGFEICGETRLKVAGIYPQFQRQLIMKKELSNDEI